VAQLGDLCAGCACGRAVVRFCRHPATAFVAQTSQSTLLLKKRKQMREVDDALEFMNEEYKARVAECERGQLEFERKQVDMKKMVAQFQQFITENDAKQRRAEIKAKVRLSDAWMTPRVSVPYAAAGQVCGWSVTPWA